MEKHIVKFFFLKIELNFFDIKIPTLLLKSNPNEAGIMTAQSKMQGLRQAITDNCLYGAWKREFDSVGECVDTEFDWFESNDDMIACAVETVMQVAEANPWIIVLISVSR